MNQQILTYYYTYWLSFFFSIPVANFIFLVPLVLITEIAFFEFGDIMRNDFHCPRCQSDKTIDRGDWLYCPHCDMEFEKEFLGKIDDEDMLGREEMDGFLKAFEDDMKYRDEDDDEEYFEEW